jgi:antitoxin HigA-1
MGTGKATKPASPSALFRAAEHLRNHADVAFYLEEMLADCDARAVPVALRTVTDALGGTRALAEKVGLSRKILYRTLSDSRSPRFEALASILGGFGLRLSVRPAGQRRARQAVTRSARAEGESQMYKPPHPGEVLKDTVLRADGGIRVTEFATRLRLSRVALSRVMNGKAAVSAELAIRLAAALRGSAESWLRMQLAHDLWHAQRKRRPKIGPLESVRNPRRVGTVAEFFANSPLRNSGFKAK